MSAGTTVRSATSRDVEAVAPLLAGYLAFYGVERPAAEATAYLAARMDADDAVVLLAETDGGGPAGLAIAYPTWDTLELGSRWVLHDLFVAVEHRRSGIARALLKEVIARARAAGAVAISLETAHTNIAAQPLYASEGFVHDLEYRTYRLELTEG